MQKSQNRVFNIKQTIASEKRTIVNSSYSKPFPGPYPDPTSTTAPSQFTAPAHSPNNIFYDNFNYPEIYSFIV